MSNVTSCIQPEPIDLMPDATGDPATQMEKEFSTAPPDETGDLVKEAFTRYSDNHFGLFHTNNQNGKNIKDEYERYAGVQPVHYNI